jgi:hypothetical protein
VNAADRMRHTDPSLTAEVKFLERSEVNHVQSPTNSTALPDFGKDHVRGPGSRTVHDLWQEYAHGLNGREPLREKDKRGSQWRRDPPNPKAGKRGYTLMQFWSELRAIYLFIEMRIAHGDSEAVAVETCQEIVNSYLSRNGCPNWKVLSPLLRGVLDQEEKVVTTCQQIFKKYLTRNSRPISVIVGDQVHNPSSTTVDGYFLQVDYSDTRRTVHNLWQEYAYGLNGQEPLRARERDVE